MKLNYLSVVTFPIEIISNTGEVCSKATGFIYSEDESGFYLVTNWHVVTGRDGRNPTLSQKGCVPTKLRCRFHNKVSNSSEISLSQTFTIDITINNGEGNAPAWLEHPRYRYHVDVIVIKLIGENRKLLEESAKFHVLKNYGHFETRYKPEPMDTVFAIGYPWGLGAGNSVLPIYKRGSVASEPTVPIDALPKFLIDCRTSESMSGSPVIVSHSGYWQPEGASTRDHVIGTVEKFIGVYSGRLKSCEDCSDGAREREISEIGIVWKAEIIDEIIACGVSGTSLAELLAA